MPNKKIYAEVDAGIDYDSAGFFREVMDILRDGKGWPLAGLTFSIADSADVADMHFRLSTNSNIKRICNFSGMSCAHLGGKKSYINYSRWMCAPKVSGLDLSEYRRYVINHETGHLLGLPDNMSQGAGSPAPVMVQHTRGTRGYKANPRPLPDEISKIISKIGGARTKKRSTKKRKS